MKGSDVMTYEEVREDWRSLIKHVLNVYKNAKSEQFEERDAKRWIALGRICSKCNKIMSIVEEEE